MQPALLTSATSMHWRSPHYISPLSEYLVIQALNYVYVQKPSNLFSFFGRKKIKFTKSLRRVCARACVLYRVQFSISSFLYLYFIFMMVH
jgi:hypothetical protein